MINEDIFLMLTTNLEVQNKNQIEMHFNKLIFNKFARMQE